MIREISLSEARRGDILVHKGEGIVFEILSRFLRLFESWWDRWGWHMSFVVLRVMNQLTIAEARELFTGCREITTQTSNIRCYRYFDEVPDLEATSVYLTNSMGKRYDVAVYFFTMIQYLVLHFRNKSLPRILDDRYTCWELVFDYCTEMGKPITTIRKYPILTDFLKEIK
jgi:hypothetical protein